jgi:hypothetical protein
VDRKQGGKGVSKDEQLADGLNLGHMMHYLHSKLLKSNTNTINIDY